MGTRLARLTEHRGHTFDAASRIPLSLFTGVGLLVFWISHRLIAFGDTLVSVGFSSAFVQIATSPTFLLVVSLSVTQQVYCLWCIVWAETRILTRHRLDLYSLGGRCVLLSLTLAASGFIPGVVFVIIEPDLLNVWDLSFLAAVIGIQYVGVWMYLYNGVAIADWAAGNDKVELERLKMEWNDQKTLLRYMIIVLVSVMVGQVFTVMRLKYGDVFGNPQAAAEARPLILVHATQLFLLVLGWWGLVLGRCLKRIEEIKLAMKERSWAAL